MKHAIKFLSAMTATLFTMTAVPFNAFAVPEISVESEKTSIAPARCSFSAPVFGTGQDGELSVTTNYTAIEKNIDLYGEQANLPSSFDLRKSGMVNYVKDQSIYGTCWAHASVASAEMSLMKYIPDIDLSEMHTAYFPYGHDADQVIFDGTFSELMEDKGGNVRLVTNLWSQWIGPVKEEKFPYMIYDDDFIPDSSIKYDADYHLENSYLLNYNADKSNFSEVNSLLKQYIYDGNGVDVSFYSDQKDGSCYNTEYCSTNSRKPERLSNHAVTIVGWDDNFPASDFTVKPQNDGAWLVRNSWGYNYNDDGYMWISYEDRSIGEFGVFQLADAENYDTKYMHDTYVPTQNLSANQDPTVNEPSYMASVFDCTEDFYAEAVSTYILNPNTEYEVTVYTNLTDPLNPSSGTPSGTTVGKCDVTGYATIELDQSVHISAGEKYSAVVKMYCPDNQFVIPAESSLMLTNYDRGKYINLVEYSKDEQIKDNTGAGESFYSTDCKKWSDTKDFNYTYTEDEKNGVLASLKETLYRDIEPDDEESLKDAETKYSTFESKFEGSVLTSRLGNISLKVYGNKENKVKFSQVSGAVGSGEKISLSSPDGSDIYYSVNYGDYQLYTEPFEVTEKMNVKATSDYKTVSERNFRPAKPELTGISYMMPTNIPIMKGKYGQAEKVGENEYRINLPLTENRIRLNLQTNAKATMNGTELENYKFNEEINIPYGETVINFVLSDESGAENTVKLTVSKSPVSIDLESETVSIEEDYTVYDSTGNQIKNGQNVGAYAGQTFTVKGYGEETEYKVPERAEVPDMEINYYSETLGYIINEDAELLEYAVKASPSGSDYISAEKRLINGEWINSGMTMNKAFRIIPGETVVLRLRAGNGKFASIPVKKVIPSAPSAPSKIPSYETVNGKWVFGDYEYEVGIPSDKPSNSITQYSAETYGYSENAFNVLMQSRFGIISSEVLQGFVNATWSRTATPAYGKKIAVRYGATDTSFASRAVTFTVYELGDANFDGSVNAIDASLVMAHYASLSSNGSGVIPKERQNNADYNSDGSINSVDASQIMIYYVKQSTSHNE